MKDIRPDRQWFRLQLAKRGLIPIMMKQNVQGNVWSCRPSLLFLYRLQ